MRLHRFIGDFDFSKKPFRVTDGELLNQWENVLRLRPHGQIILADGRLNEAVAEIKSISKDLAELEIGAISKNEKEPPIATSLFCAVLKKENFELVVQKATEAGAKEIIPIITGRTIKTKLNLDRLEKIAKEAAEQSGRGIVPAIGSPISFEEAMKHARENNAPLFFEPGAPLFDAARLKNSGAKSASVLVGPEGGWDDSEIETARKQDLKVVGLGGLTLRSETAAVISTYLVANATNL